MLSKYLKPGARIELHTTQKRHGSGIDEKKVYYSKVYDIVSEYEMEVLMPIEKGKLVLLPEGEEYVTVLYGDSCLYQCVVSVAKRYKTDNMYILLLELQSNLHKYQRREYYRYDCLIEMEVRPLLEEEIRGMESDLFYRLREDLPTTRATIVDISGGGLRFLSGSRFEKNTLLFCTFQLAGKEKARNMEVMNMVLRFKELEEHKGTYEYHTMFHKPSERVREEIVKWIFEQERYNRRKSLFSDMQTE